MPRPMSWKGVTTPKRISVTLKDLDADRQTLPAGARRDLLRLRSGTLDAKQFRAYVAMIEDLHRRTTMLPVLRALRDRKVTLVQVWHAYQAGPEALNALMASITAVRLVDLIPTYKRSMRGIREIDARVRKIRRFLDWLGVGATPADFTSDKVEDFLGELDFSDGFTRRPKAGEDARQLSLSTLNNYRTAISSFATWMVRRNLLAKHPIAYKAVPRKPTPRGRLPEPFSPDDYRQYLDKVGERSGLARVAVATMLHTGADLGEIIFTYGAHTTVKKHPEQQAAIGLRAKDVVLSDAPNGPNFLRLQRAKWKGAKERLVPIPKALAAELRGVIALYGAKGSDEVFGQLTEYALREAHEAARKAIGRPTLRFKDLRHIAAIRWAQSGAVDLKKIQEYLGHETLTQTAVYIDYIPKPDHVAQAAEDAAAAWTNALDVADLAKRKTEQGKTRKHG